jgi:hypothetical protein
MSRARVIRSKCRDGMDWRTLRQSEGHASPRDHEWLPTKREAALLHIVHSTEGPQRERESEAAHAHRTYILRVRRFLSDVQAGRKLCRRGAPSLCTSTSNSPPDGAWCMVESTVTLHNEHRALSVKGNLATCTGEASSDKCTVPLEREEHGPHLCEPERVDSGHGSHVLTISW